MLSPLLANVALHGLETALRAAFPWRGLVFLDPEELIEGDHRTPLRFGGDHGDRNRQLLHGHGHDQQTAADGSLVARGRREVPVTRAKLARDD